MNPVCRHSRNVCARRILPVFSFTLAPLAAQAHVKWFAPYIVEAPPQRVLETLTDRWFWLGIFLVLVFFRPFSGDVEPVGRVPPAGGPRRP